MPEQQEWTLMFFLASDNALAPGIVSQLKAIKNAGHYPGANVIVQYDPQTIGTPTHIFEVNGINKLKHPGGNIGFRGDDPFIRNLMEDKLWNDEKDRSGNDIRDKLKDLLAHEHGGLTYNPPFPPENDQDGEPGVAESLGDFLTFCAESYPARHYMLFILGHGVVVANDIFLFDEHAAEHSLTLTQLGSLLLNFKHKIRLHNGKFELISLHSCSVSAIEVAYELQGTANYMLATQGPAFVGSWPYRQILIRIFNDLKHGRPNDVDHIKEMVKKIFFYCLYNSTDFMLAGYSFDLCLCNLTRVPLMTQALRRLTMALAGGVADSKLRNHILLAHWRSQSYWQESYTDVADFCFCLLRELRNEQCECSDTLDEIISACGDVLSVLRKETGTFNSRGGSLPASEYAPKDKGSDHVILLAEFAGPAYQYSNGLSVYFPWSQPETDIPVLEEYRRYKFNRETSWLTFLQMYWAATMRATHKTEDQATNPNPSPDEDEIQNLFEDIASLMFNPQGALSRTAELEKKTDPTDPTGDDCTCPSIKNFPHDTRAQEERWAQAASDGLPIGNAFLSDFFTRRRKREATGEGDRRSDDGEPRMSRDVEANRDDET